MLRPLAILLVALLAGCGNERTAAPDVTTPAEPAGTRLVALDRAGVRFTAPANWPDLSAVGSRAGGVASGVASVAVWRYPRAEPLPAPGADMRRAARRLAERVAERDPSAELDRPAVGRRSIELTGTQTIDDVRVGVRSLHLFGFGAEVVVDAYAPVAQFARVDREVFQPLVDTVRLRRPR